MKAFRFGFGGLLLIFRFDLPFIGGAMWATLRVKETFSTDMDFVEGLCGWLSVVGW